MRSGDAGADDGAGAAACVRLQLLDALDGPASVVELTAEALARVDTAGLQLLAAFVRDARAHHKDIRWVSPSATLIAAAGRLGLTGGLGLDGAGPGNGV